MPRSEDALFEYAARKGWMTLGAGGQLVVERESPTALLDLIRGRGVDLHQEVEGTGRGLVVVTNPGVEPIERQSAVIERMQLVAARAAIEKAWQSRGGAASPVGLPLSKQIKVTKEAEGVWVANFRGGRYELRDHDGRLVPMEITTRHAFINLVGIECQIRQESEDELYAVITVMGPANRLVQTVTVPNSGTISLGPDGLRIFQASTNLLSEGQVQDYHLVVSLIEHDSGDAENIARYITDKAKEAASAILQSQTGYGAEAVSEDQSELMYYFGLWLIGDVLGMGDDAYNSGGIRIRAGELMAPTGPEHQPPVTRADDPRVISNWTHKITVSGIDDGGDVGQYAFYFDVSVEDFRRTVFVPVQH